MLTQYSRISHHTVTDGGLTQSAPFSVPASEDFVTSDWTPYDLALSELGVDELNEQVYIRIGQTIRQLGLVGNPGSGAVFGQISSQTQSTVIVSTQSFYYPTGQVGILGLSSGMIIGSEGLSLENISGATQTLFILGSCDAKDGNNTSLGLRIAYNGVDIPSTECRAFAAAGADQSKLLSSTILEMGNGDEVSLRIANHTSTGNIDVYRSRIVAVPIATTGQPGPQGPTGPTGSSSGPLYNSIFGGMTASTGIGTEVIYSHVFPALSIGNQEGFTFRAGFRTDIGTFSKTITVELDNQTVVDTSAIDPIMDNCRVIIDFDAIRANTDIAISGISYITDSTLNTDSFVGSGLLSGIDFTQPVTLTITVDTSVATDVEMYTTKIFEIK